MNKMIEIPEEELVTLAVLASVFAMHAVGQNPKPLNQLLTHGDKLEAIMHQLEKEVPDFWDVAERVKAQLKTEAEDAPSVAEWLTRALK